MGSKIEIFFGKFATYIVAFLMGCAIFLGAGWYVSNVRLEAARDHSQKVEAQLQVSNASYSSIKGQYQALTNQLADNQKAILTNQETIKTGLVKMESDDVARKDLEKRLLNRAPTTDCAMPKDLIDAWKQL